MTSLQVLQLAELTILLLDDLALPCPQTSRTVVRLRRLLRLPEADRRQEGLEMRVEVCVGDAEIPVKQEEELLLHQVDLRRGEAKLREARHTRVSRPVFILRRRVV